MRKIFILLLLILSTNSFSQEKEDIYLVYIGGVEKTVDYSPRRDGANKKPRKYVPEFHTGCFVFYKDYFQIVPNSKVELVKQEDAKSFKIITINDFLRIRESNEKTQISNPNNLFRNIFILVPNEHNDYYKFDVDWIEYISD